MALAAPPSQTPSSAPHTPIAGQCTGHPGDPQQDRGRSQLRGLGRRRARRGQDGGAQEHTEETVGTLTDRTTCQLVLESQERLPGAQGLGRLGGKGLSRAARSGPLPTQSSRRAVQTPATRSPGHAHLLSHQARDGGKQGPGRPFPGAQLCSRHCGLSEGQETPRPLRVHPAELSKSLNQVRGFPGSRVVKTLHFHCQGPRFNPRSESKDPTEQAAEKQETMTRKTGVGAGSFKGTCTRASQLQRPPHSPREVRETHTSR